MTIPPTDRLKAEARALRDLPDGPATHAAALEAVAEAHGFRDWNTAAAAAPPNLKPGLRARGRYLGHPVEGRLHRVETRDDGWRIAFDLDQPVNVSASEAFEVTRRRLQASLGWDGRTAEATSDGRPHLALDLQSIEAMNRSKR